MTRTQLHKQPAPGPPDGDLGDLLELRVLETRGERPEGPPPRPRRAPGAAQAAPTEGQCSWRPTAEPCQQVGEAASSVLLTLVICLANTSLQTAPDKLQPSLNGGHLAPGPTTRLASLPPPSLSDPGLLP